MKHLNALGNLEVHEKEDYALFSVNPKIFPLDIIYSASYILIDKAYIFLDGDPEKKILVEIRKKDVKDDLKKIVYDFNNELLNYSVYKKQSEKNQGVREAILQKILLSNDPNYFNAASNQPKEEKIEDPESILKIWEDSEDKLENEELTEKKIFESEEELQSDSNDDKELDKLWKELQNQAKTDNPQNKSKKKKNV